MRRHIYAILSLVAITLLAGSCSDDEVTPPMAAISVSQTRTGVDESVEVKFTGSAENVVIFPGDQDHDYEKVSESNTGLVVNKGLLTYAYSTPGVYKMVCVATNHANEGQTLLRDTCSVWIRVVDEENRIDKISAYPVVRDEIFATPVNDVEWLMAFPRNMRYQSSNPAVTLSRKLKFYTRSSSCTVSIDGTDFSISKSYDLSKPLNIVATSYSGIAREYRLHTLYYGEFKTFTLAGVKGTIERDPFIYNSYAINMTLPSGTDLTALSPEFTLMANNEKVYVGDAEQVSGTSTQDFSRPVTYRFVTTSEINPAISVESTCTVSVK